MCSYVMFSLQKSTSGSAQRSPSPQRNSSPGSNLEKEWGVAVNGGLAFG
jgi:hypothetical protein